MFELSVAPDAQSLCMIGISTCTRANIWFLSSRELVSVFARQKILCVYWSGKLRVSGQNEHGKTQETRIYHVATFSFLKNRDQAY
jgi:hypothetical protein